MHVDLALKTKKNNPRRRVGEKRIYLLGKGPGQSLFTADFLGADETIDGDGDGAVDVLGGAVFREAHFAKGFADAHDGFEVADLDGWGCQFRIRFSTMVCVYAPWLSRHRRDSR